MGQDDQSGVPRERKLPEVIIELCWEGGDGSGHPEE